MIITLLNLPLELPRDSPAWTNESATLLTGLGEWIRRCRSLFLMPINVRPNFLRSNFRRWLLWPTRCGGSRCLCFLRFGMLMRTRGSTCNDSKVSLLWTWIENKSLTTSAKIYRHTSPDLLALGSTMRARSRFLWSDKQASRWLL